MVHNPDDLRMAYTDENGVKIEIYDTYCKNFTWADKEVVDAKINEIYQRAMRRKMLVQQGTPDTGA